jgi:hypothetical protein
MWICPRSALALAILVILPFTLAVADEPEAALEGADPAAQFATLRNGLEQAVADQLARMREASAQRERAVREGHLGDTFGKDSAGTNSASNSDFRIPLNEEILARVKSLQEGDSGRLKRARMRLEAFAGALERSFAAEGVPAELVWLGMVESAFKPGVRSEKGALGMWQLTVGTAFRHGLRVQGAGSARGADSRSDERRDPIKSAIIAARYLRELYERFGDWQLALAAYNAGEQRVEKAIRLGRAKDFWTLSKRKLLPAETRDYVPAVFAAIWAARLEWPTLRELSGTGKQPERPAGVRSSKASVRRDA